MSKYIYVNPNPRSKRVGDCVVRALSIAMNRDWQQVYAGICLQGFLMCDMPSANNVWGAFLRSQGFTRGAIPDYLPENYSVRDFCRDTPRGTFVLACEGHVVAVIDGNYYDTWDSGDKIPLYYWERRD